jgi:hypothetical protein
MSWLYASPITRRLKLGASYTSLSFYSPNIQPNTVVSSARDNASIHSYIHTENRVTNSYKQVIPRVGGGVACSGVALSVDGQAGRLASLVVSSLEVGRVLNSEACSAGDVVADAGDEAVREGLLGGVVPVAA